MNFNKMPKIVNGETPEASCRRTRGGGQVRRGGSYGNLVYIKIQKNSVIPQRVQMFTTFSFVRPYHRKTHECFKDNCVNMTDWAHEWASLTISALMNLTEVILSADVGLYVNLLSIHMCFASVLLIWLFWKCNYVSQSMILQFPTSSMLLWWLVGQINKLWYQLKQTVGWHVVYCLCVKALKTFTLKLKSMNQHIYSVITGPWWGPVWLLRLSSTVICCTVCDHKMEAETQTADLAN